ncbi:hypothetical protein [Mesorhizobium sp.]|uniref:hypothetical protein n=1 Tax=Mesorhizobium sp. TaxID=1871066 RepID=UPI0025CEC279|nr:hypothetical protein [Mesorhizobium sp.]
MVVAGVAIGLLPEAHDAPLHKFRNHCRSEGMDFRETEAAIASRMAFVRLRRMASDKCIAQAGNMSRDEINQIAAQLAIGLAASRGTDVGQKFITWIDDCPDEEILYDDARAARHRHHVGALREQGHYPPKNVKLHDDYKHAFKIVKR